MRTLCLLALLLGLFAPRPALRAAELEVSSLEELAAAVEKSGQTIRLRPGIYRLADYLTNERIAAIAQRLIDYPGRPISAFFPLTGSDNRIDARGAVIEVDTRLYARAPAGSYPCTFVLVGSGNTILGLELQSVAVDPDQGGATMVCLVGERNTLEDVTLRLNGSFPYGYGDLLGKGGPNLVLLSKQSGVRILGSASVLRRCKVFNRAFGHSYYIQAGDGIRLEDCYAEGVMRPTEDMLRDTTGPAYGLGFRSVYLNRDGRYQIAPGYMKSLTEDGFRTYGNAGSVTLVNCTAVNTRAGFEIGARDDAPVKTVVENCVAIGCERGFLIGSQTIVRRSRGDLRHGPLLYLRGGRDSEVELELIGEGPQSLVHAIATVAGENHRLKLTAMPGTRPLPALPVLIGFGMPDHAEMSSPIRPAPTRRLTVDSEIASSPVILSDTVVDSQIRAAGRTQTDAELRANPGSWGLPENGIAPGGPRRN